MRPIDFCRQNLAFVHDVIRVPCQDLTPEQLHWQPENHDSTIMFVLWHAIRSEDELVHGLIARKPTVFSAGGWAERLPVAKTGITPFGTGLDREGIAAIRLELPALLDYTAAVRDSVIAYVESLTDEEAMEPVPLPFFKEPFGFDSLSRIEALNFFCVGHIFEHQGEVFFLRGLMGLKGHPL